MKCREILTVHQSIPAPPNVIENPATEEGTYHFPVKQVILSSPWTMQVPTIVIASPWQFGTCELPILSSLTVLSLSTSRALTSWSNAKECPPAPTSEPSHVPYAPTLARLPSSSSPSDRRRTRYCFRRPHAVPEVDYNPSDAGMCR